MTFAPRWETAVRTGGDRPAGMTAGSSVHVALRNCPAFIAIWLACARSGAWLVPVDPTSTARDIGRQLDRVRPAAGICAASRADVYAAGVAESAAGRRTVIELTETAADVALAADLAGTTAGVAGPVAAVAPADRLAVMFTSGTTSEPKGVVLTQHNYAQVADAMSEIGRAHV